jgi:hypothetical protein
LEQQVLLDLQVQIQQCLVQQVLQVHKEFKAMLVRLALQALKERKA